MKRSMLIGFVLVGVLLIGGVLWLSPPALSQAASAQAPHIGEGGLPQFEKDPAWPKVPAKWKMGFGSAVAIDADDHVWILSRPHTLPKIQSAMAAPPAKIAGTAEIGPPRWNNKKNATVPAPTQMPVSAE